MRFIAPFPSVRETMSCLRTSDLLSLQTSSMQCLQRACDGIPGAEWNGYERALSWYCIAIEDELQHRKVRASNVTYSQIARYVERTSACDWKLTGWPKWLTNEETNRSDQLMLYKSDPSFYTAFAPEESAMPEDTPIKPAVKAVTPYRKRGEDAQAAISTIVTELNTREEEIEAATQRFRDAEDKLLALHPAVKELKELIATIQLEVQDLEDLASMRNSHRAKAKGKQLRATLDELSLTLRKIS